MLKAGSRNFETSHTWIRSVAVLYSHFTVVLGVRVDDAPDHAIFLGVLDFYSTVATPIRSYGDLAFEFDAGFFQRGEVFPSRTAVSHSGQLCERCGAGTPDLTQHRRIRL